MNCGFSKEILALYVENDLPSNEMADKVEAHILSCNECREYSEQLRRSQSFIKERFQWTHQAPVSQESLTRVRRSVMSQVETVSQNLGWTVRLERFFTLGLRRNRYALAGFAILVIVSASLLGQMRYSVQKDGLLAPANYREWVSVGCCSGAAPAEGSGHGSLSKTQRNVYINPVAYREYRRSGKFPDGTVMVLETLAASNEEGVIGLQVSVRDSNRFDGGWAFYDFTEARGKVKRQAEPLPQTAGCIACHRQKGGADHVFTQFYPVLNTVRS